MHTKELDIKIDNYPALGAHLSVLFERDNMHGHAAGHIIDKDLLAYLLELKTRLTKNVEECSKTIKEIPNSQCRLSEIFLEDNIPWFVAYYLENSPIDECRRVIIHLNSCYYCAQIFANVHENAAPSNAKDGRSVKE
ncbi:MAG: hypothetical protein ACRBF0_15255 [Calditrichia bacterium]